MRWEWGGSEISARPSFHQLAEALGKPLAVLAVEEVAHGSSAGFVRFHLYFAVVGGRALLLCGGGVRFAARRTAVGEAGFVGLQLELLGTDGANSERESHPNIMIQASPWPNP